jgi:hypothetical protein
LYFGESHKIFLITVTTAVTTLCYTGFKTTVSSHPKKSIPMTTPPVPFPGSYWVLPGKLLAGYCPGSKDPKEATEKLTALIRDLRKDCEDSSRESPEMRE